MARSRRAGLSAGSIREVEGKTVLDRRPLKAPKLKPGPITRLGKSGLAISEPKKLPWAVVLFLIALIVPWTPTIGPIRLSMYRVVLIVTILPCLYLWLTGKAGRIRTPDIALVLYSVWCALSLVVVHGVQSGLQSGGIVALETLGAYLLARCYIRDADSFYRLTSLLFRIVAILLPFAILETLTGRKPFIELFGSVLPTVPIDIREPRWGLWRTQGPFDHPILFGVCCSSIFAMTHLVLGYKKPLVQRWFRTGLVIATSFLAISSGPLSALAAQGLLLSWNWLLRRVKERWMLLWVLIGAMYILISIVSNQSVPAFYITHIPIFDAESAYYRILIWEFGSESVLNNPLFGTGYGEWIRPWWMTSSIDMFWLVHAVFFGIPAAVLMFLAFAACCWSVAFTKGLDEKLLSFRTGYLIAMAGFFLVGWTVHFWNATYVLFLFLLGSGAWFADVNLKSPDRNSRKKTSEQKIRRA